LQRLRYALGLNRGGRKQTHVGHGLLQRRGKGEI
jgi:hypothetical protein